MDFTGLCARRGLHDREFETKCENVWERRGYEENGRKGQRLTDVTSTLRYSNGDLYCFSVCVCVYVPTVLSRLELRFRSHSSSDSLFFTTPSFTPSSPHCNVPAPLSFLLSLRPRSLSRVLGRNCVQALAPLAMLSSASSLYTSSLFFSFFLWTWMLRAYSRESSRCDTYSTISFVCCFVSKLPIASFSFSRLIFEISAEGLRLNVTKVRGFLFLGCSWKTANDAARYLDICHL